MDSHALFYRGRLHRTTINKSRAQYRFMYYVSSSKPDIAFTFSQLLRAYFAQIIFPFVLFIRNYTFAL